MGPRSYLFLFPLFYSTTVKPTHGCQCSDIIDPLILIFDFNILPSKSRLLNLFFIFFSYRGLGYDIGYVAITATLIFLLRTSFGAIISQYVFRALFFFS